jgi:hypothetical protein
MPARTKRRAKCIFRGRLFVWGVDGDRYLRISSADKKFVIAFPLGTADDPPVVEVIGREFPGIDASEQRPVRLLAPQPAGKSMGAWVDGLLRWAFDPTHELVRFDGPLHFM